MKSPDIQTKIHDAAAGLGGKVYISRRGVPLVEMMNAFGDGVNYSVCYFANSGVWRIFKGYNDFSCEQARITVPHLVDVKSFFSSQPYSTVTTRRCAKSDCKRYIRVPESYCRKHKS